MLIGGPILCLWEVLYVSRRSYMYVGGPIC